MTNEDMKPGRFLRWQQARRTAAKIASHLESGGRVVVGTYTQATVYGSPQALLRLPTSRNMLSKTPSGEPQNAHPTVSSLLTGISPMHCIGRMERFQRAPKARNCLAQGP
jgi:hypothetical protein